MQQCYRWAFFAVLFVFTSGVGAAWSIPSASLTPDPVSGGGTFAVMANVLDDAGQPVTPSRCSATVTLDYGSETVPMEHISGYDGWYTADMGVSGASNATITADGSCDGGSSSASELLAITTGSVKVSFVTDMSQSFSTGQSIDLEWYVQYGNNFITNGPTNYRVLAPDGSVLSEGSLSDGSVQTQNRWYKAPITLPDTTGTYIIAVSSNWDDGTGGGTAARIQVGSSGSTDDGTDDTGDTTNDTTDGTDGGSTGGQLDGTLQLAGQGCSFSGENACSAGATVDVTAEVTAGTPSTATVRVTGNGQLYDSFDLSQASSTTWTGSFDIDPDFDRSQYGDTLSVIVNLSNTDDKMLLQDELTVTDRTFRIRESTASYTTRGDAIDILIGAEYTDTGEPVPPDQLSEIGFRITDPAGNVMVEDGGRAPFTYTPYDADKNRFEWTVEVPPDADLGTYTVGVRVTDMAEQVQGKQFTFTVEDTTDERPITLVGVGGTLQTTSFSKEFADPGVKTVNVLLNNSGDSPALVDISFDGDLETVAQIDQSLPLSIPAGSLKQAGIELQLSEQRTYSGTATFQVHGSYVTPYSISLPMTLSVASACVRESGVLCLTTDLAETTVSETGPFTVSFGLQNTGGTTTAQITPQGALQDLFEQQDVTLSNGANTVSLEGAVAPDQGGAYRDTVMITTDTASIELDTKVTVDLGGTITMNTSTTSLGTFTPEDTIQVPVTIRNRGSTPIPSVNITAASLNIQVQRNVFLDPGQQTTLRLTGIVPNREGDREADIQVQAGSGVTASDTVQYTAFRDYGDSFDLLETRITTFQDRLENKENTSAVQQDISRMETLIQEGRDAWESEDYFTAREKYQEAQDIGQLVDQRIAQLPSSGGNSGGGGGGQVVRPIVIPIVPIVVLLVVLIVVGVVVYLSLVPEEEETQGFFELQDEE